MEHTEPLCKRCRLVATCTVGDELMCEAHGMYWSKVKNKPMERLHDSEKGK